MSAQSYLNMGSLRSTSYATFRVGTMRFGIDAEEVQEFLVAQRLTPVPLSEPVIAGLINLRGQIITAIDMRIRLGLPPQVGQLPFNIVIRSQKAVRSLQVDEIGDVIEVAASDHEAPTATLAEEVRGVLSHVCKVNGGLLLIVNSSEILKPKAQ